MLIQHRVLEPVPAHGQPCYTVDISPVCPGANTYKQATINAHTHKETSFRVDIYPSLDVFGPDHPGENHILTGEDVKLTKKGPRDPGRPLSAGGLQTGAFFLLWGDSARHCGVELWGDSVQDEGCGISPPYLAQTRSGVRCLNLPCLGEVGRLRSGADPGLSLPCVATSSGELLSRLIQHARAPASGRSLFNEGVSFLLLTLQMPRSGAERRRPG